MKRLISLGIVLLMTGCQSKGMSAQAACESLTKAGFGSNCKADKPGGLASAAWEAYTFDLPDPKGKGCGVFSFRKAEDLDATEKAFQGAAALAGPHRYGSKSKLIFVQCNEGMPRDKGAELEKAVGKL